MLEIKGETLIDLQNITSKKERNEARQKILEGFLKNQQDHQDKKESRLAKSAIREQTRASEELTFKPIISQASKELVQNNKSRPGNFTDRNEYYEDRKKFHNTIVKNNMDKDMSFKPIILQRKSPNLKQSHMSRFLTGRKSHNVI